MRVSEGKEGKKRSHIVKRVKKSARFSRGIRRYLLDSEDFHPPYPPYPPLYRNQWNPLLHGDPLIPWGSVNPIEPDWASGLKINDRKLFSH